MVRNHRWREFIREERKSETWSKERRERLKNKRNKFRNKLNVRKKIKDEVRA